MKKPVLFGSLVALLALLLAILFIGTRFFRPNKPGFRRFSFERVEAFQKLSFDEKTFGWQDKNKNSLGMAKTIARGAGMLIVGQGRLSLKPGLQGEKGLLLHLAVQSWDKNEIRVAVGVSDGGKTRVFDEFKNKSGYRTISRTLSLRPRDEIVITAAGRGAVIAGEPVLYDIIARPKRKYIFLIAVDTLRGDKIGMKRGGLSLTPHIDRFKADAVTFVNHFVQSSWTLPFFMSLFTGLYEHNHQVPRGGPLASSKPFLVRELSRNFVMAYMHGGGWMNARFGYSRGMDHFSLESNPKDQDGGRKMFAAASAFMARNPVPSLFMFLHTYQVHHPYYPPAEFLRLLDKQPRHFKLTSFTHNEQFIRQVAPDLRQDMEELYEAEILAFDHYFGEFVRQLKATGIYDQSLIVFLADHGEEFYEHGGWGHGHSLYNEIIKVPLLIKFPGNRSAGRVIQKNTANIDVLPTLLDCSAIEVPAGLDGASLLPLLAREDGPEKVFHRHLLSSTSNCRLEETFPAKFAVIFGQYKLIYNYRFSQPELDYYAGSGLPPVNGGMELYDLKNDPRETANLYPGKMALPASVKAEIAAMVRRLAENKRLSRGMGPGLDAEEKEQLETLGYL